MIRLITLLVFVFVLPCWCRVLYPFNAPTQRRLDNLDDECSAEFNLAGSFPFFGTNYNKYSVSCNGLLIFGPGCIRAYTPIPFPTATLPVLAVYWGDADFRDGLLLFHFPVKIANNPIDVPGGSPSTAVYHMSYTGPSPIDSNTFTATEWIQATWYRVGYYQRKITRYNTFQFVFQPFYE